MQPQQVLKNSIKAVPAVKYALGIAGIVAVVAIIGSFSIDYRIALFGGLIVFIGMALLVVFASVAGLSGKKLRAPAMVLTWFTLVMLMLTTFCLFMCVFFAWPQNLVHWLAPEVTSYSIPPKVREKQLHKEGALPFPAPTVTFADGTVATVEFAVTTSVTEENAALVVVKSGDRGSAQEALYPIAEAAVIAFLEPITITEARSKRLNLQEEIVVKLRPKFLEYGITLDHLVLKEFKVHQ
ncbi:MAG: SPFH domain-containing protein [bacterium]